MNTKSCIFGTMSSSNQAQINPLGQFCGIDDVKLEILTKPNRGFLDRITDVLLLDPSARLANAIGRVSARKYIAEVGNVEGFARRDISIRKNWTAISAILYVMTFIIDLSPDPEFIQKACSKRSDPAACFERANQDNSFTIYCATYLTLWLLLVGYINFSYLSAAKKAFAEK